MKFIFCPKVSLFPEPSFVFLSNSGSTSSAAGSCWLLNKKRACHDSVKAAMWAAGQFLQNPPASRENDPEIVFLGKWPRKISLIGRWLCECLWIVDWPNDTFACGISRIAWQQARYAKISLAGFQCQSSSHIAENVAEGGKSCQNMIFWPKPKGGQSQTRMAPSLKAHCLLGFTKSHIYPKLPAFLDNTLTSHGSHQVRSKAMNDPGWVSRVGFRSAVASIAAPGHTLDSLQKQICKNSKHEAQTADEHWFIWYL